MRSVCILDCLSELEIRGGPGAIELLAEHIAALVQRGLPADDDNVRRVRELAHAAQRTLTETELRDACGPMR